MREIKDDEKFVAWAVALQYAAHNERLILATEKAARDTGTSYEDVKAIYMDIVLSMAQNRMDISLDIAKQFTDDEKRIIAEGSNE